MLSFTPAGSLMTVQSSTGHSLRPDGMLLTIDERMLFKWEEKGSGGLRTAMSELSAKTAVWTPLYYGDLPYLLCMAAAGPLVQFCVVHRGAPGSATPVGGVIDLDSLGGRVQAVMAAINLYRLLLAAQKYLPVNILPVGQDLIAINPLGFKRTL